MRFLISIITVNYNNGDGLKKTIDSVTRQKDSSLFEYIVIDGGSSDSSVEVIKEYSSNIDIIISEPDTGIYNAMNKGVKLAHGAYCLFMNSGDYFYSDISLQSALPSLNQIGIDFVIGREKYANTGGYSDIEHPITLNTFYNGSIPHQATFIKTSLLRENPYDETYKIVSDWKFFIEELIIKNRSYAMVDDVISYYDGEGVSAQRKDLVLKERAEVWESLFPERVMLDYLNFNKGQGYENTYYDKFYIELRKHSISKMIYFFDVLFVKILSLIKKSLLFSRFFKLTY